MLLNINMVLHCQQKKEDNTFPNANTINTLSSENVPQSTRQSFANNPYQSSQSSIEERGVGDFQLSTPF